MNKRFVSVSLITALIFAALACGGGGDSNGGVEVSSDVEAQSLYAPIYSDFPPPTGEYEADLSDTTAKVEANQAKGSRLTRIIAKNGIIRLDEDTVVRLTEIAKNDCPSSLGDCDEVDSQTLGIGDSALLVDTATAAAAIRNQSERGTCVAFGVNGAIEVLLKQSGNPLDLSEQNTYFLGKKLTDTWDLSGLNPMDAAPAIRQGTTSTAPDGVEHLFGSCGSVDGSRGQANRLQMSFIFELS